MSTKRTLSQRSNKSATRSPTKKAKTTNPNNYFHKTLQECGITLRDPPDKCIMSSQETIHVVRNLKKQLERHFEYPRNVSELYSDIEKECEDLGVFKQYLFPNIVRMSEDSLTEFPVADSVLKILLSIPILQTKLTDFIFEKATDLAALSQCGPWIQTILKCFSSLDSIVDGEKMSTNLINLLDIASEKMVRLEIITFIPDIIGDQEHNNISTELTRILSEDHDLIPAILECMSYLCVSDEHYDILQKKTLNILGWLTKCNYFPNIVKFLLNPSHTNENTVLEAVQGLRDALSWPTSVSKTQIDSSQVLTSIAIRNSMVSSKAAANAWLKVVSNCKISTDHKPIDIIILLILYSTSEEKQKQVENLIRKHIKLDIIKEDLLVEVFQKFKAILKDNLKYLTELTNLLLKNKSDPEVQAVASSMYTLMFSELEDQTICQTLVAELLQLGLDSKQCIMSILLILKNVATKNMSLLKSQSVQMLTLLDRMDDMPLTEIRETMNLLCGLAYSYKNSVIRDDLHMIIRKELGSSNQKVKIQGILAGIHAVKYLMTANADDPNEETREMPDDVSYSSVTHLPEGDLREAAHILEMISRSTKQNSDMAAFFYDELSKIISNAPQINKNFMSWLTDAVTNDLQQNFIVDNLATEQIGDLKLCMQYCSNTDSEMDEVIAINIAGLTLQSRDDVYIGILSPLFQLVQTLHSKQNDGNLSSIDALLGCAIIMPKFDIDLMDDMETGSITNILDCLVHCVNWFRELLNAFASQEDEALREKILRRVKQISEIERIIAEILIKTNISYKPPVRTFNINKYSNQIDNKALKVKQKNQKKNAAEDSVLPETSRTQPTQQNNAAAKNKTDTGLNISFRQLNLGLLKLLNLNMTNENESDTDLTVKTLNFILMCINNNIEGCMFSKIKKKTFLSKNTDAVYDARKAEECAKAINEMMPKVVIHLEFVTSYIETHTGRSSQDSGFIYNSEMMDYISCLESFYNMLTIFFKWMGFKNHHTPLLKTALRTLANSDTVIMSLKDLLKAVVEKFEKHENYCLQLSTAVSLIELLSTFQSYSDNKHILKILRNLAQNFLSQQWKTPEGALEKGIMVNQSVDRLASVYFMNTEILALKNLTLQLTNDIKYLKTRNDTLSTMKCINKSNFPILYRNLGTALHEATKSSLNKGMTNSEHLSLWKEVATIMKYMSEIAKTLENRNNLTAFFKKSMPVLKLFLSQGIPIMELQFKSETQEVLEILKILQQSTRFLQSLCCHSRLKKDTALMSKVPYMRQLLETLVYKVKAALAANKCSEAFWMGNLKNKNIHGEIITSQSTESDESAEDCDDQLPEDDDSGNSDDEMLHPDSKSVSDIV